MILLYVTAKDKAEAEKISNHLIQQKLIACSNFFPINSIFGTQNETEYALLLKTTEQQTEKITEEINSIHSYDTPCILKLPVQSLNKEYTGWLVNQL